MRGSWTRCGHVVRRLVVPCVAAVAILATGCGDPVTRPPVQTAAVRPVNVELVGTGGATPPSGEFVDLVVTCQQAMVAGQDDQCAEIAEQGLQSNDPLVRSAAFLLYHISRLNRGERGTFLPQSARMEQALAVLPEESEPGFTEIYYRAAAIAHQEGGDPEAAREATLRAVAVAPPERRGQIDAERCAVPGSGCTATTTAAPTGGGDPRTTAPQPTAAPPPTRQEPPKEPEKPEKPQQDGTP